MGNVIEESWAIDRKNVGEAPTLTANITRTYDSEGRLIKKVYTDIHGDTRTTEYTYDSAGKLSYAVETGDNLSVDKIEYNYVYANIYTFK
jgi:YD repeat-containing protein